VTAFLDLFSAETEILPLRDRQRATPFVGADIFAAGPCLTATNGHCSEYGVFTRIIDTAEDARRQVSALAAEHPDVVKIVYDHTPFARPTLDLDTLRAAIDTATRFGIKTVIHIGTWNDAREAVLAGASAITHVYADEIVPADVVELMRDRGVYSIPTLTVHSDLADFVGDPSILESDLASAIAIPRIRNGYDDEHRFDAWGTAA
jgi:hypothetical protein